MPTSKNYFDSIPKDRMMTLVEAKIADSKVVTLLEAFLNQKILEGLEAWTPEDGTPQGAVISPLLANIYLDPLDHLMASAGFEMVRYADDFVILCRNQAVAEQALAAIRAWTTEARLTLHPEKTRLVDASQKGGFDFLGYHFERDYKWPRKKSLAKLKTTIRTKTPRNSGDALKSIIGDVTRTLRGWFEYFKHSHKQTFLRLDKWIRMRLRSILRKRTKRRGRGHGRDHQRWPNAFFREQGLFSLVTAHERLCQSSSR